MQDDSKVTVVTEGRVPIECPHCKGVAFWINDTLKVGDEILYNVVMFNDGSHPEPGSYITCQHCKKPIQDITVNMFMEDKSNGKS